MMKRSDIRNAFDQMNPTMQQKEKMHRAIMEAYVGKQGRYQAKPTVNRRWSWIPAAAALFAVILISVFVLPLSNNQIALTAFHFQSNTLQNLFHSGLYKANVEWAKYLDENENKIRNAMYSSENGIYNDFYCTDDIMRTALDKLCSKYGLVLSEESIILNDYDLLLDKLGISTTFKTATGVKYDMDGWISAYCKDGTFCFGGTTAMTYEDSADSYSMHYVLTRVVMPVFHPNLLELANIPLCELQEYTTEDGVEVLLALGEDKSFLVTEVDDSVILVKLFRYDTADLVDAFEMNMEALTEFAETFDFQLIAQADSSPTVENMAYARETVNIYAEAQLESSIVGQFEQGTQRKILQRQNVNNINWLQIEEGWIKKDSVELRYVPEDDGYNPPAHEALLDVYRTAIKEGWTEEKCLEKGISPQLADVPYTEEKPAYVLLDIDGNDVEELIIGEGMPHYFYVWDLYAFDNEDQPIKLHTDTKDHINCHLYENGIIGTEFTGKTEGAYSYFRLNGPTLFSTDILTYRNDYWYDEVNKQQISQEKAHEILAKYKMLNVEPAALMDAAKYNHKNIEAAEQYSIILEKYRTALAEHWDPGKCVENGISLMVGYYGGLVTQLGHNQMDLNGDGNDELIITDGTNIYDLYTIVSDEEVGPLRLIDATERSQYFLTTDGHIYNVGSGSAMLSYYYLFNVGQRELELDKAYKFDASVYPDNPWFYYDGTNQEVAITTEEAAAAMDAIHFEEIAFIPFE